MGSSEAHYHRRGVVAHASLLASCAVRTVFPDRRQVKPTMMLSTLSNRKHLQEWVSCVNSVDV
jgi:hypothetical protein